METQPKFESNPPSWLNLVETFSVAASVGGSIAAIFLQQVGYASVPLSVSVVLNLVNRRQLFTRLNQDQGAIAQLQTQWQENQQAQQSISTQVQQHQQGLGNHSQIINALQQSLSSLNQGHKELHLAIEKHENQQQQLKNAMSHLREIESLTQMIRANPNSNEGYYKRGLVYQGLGDTQAALADYNKAIQLDPNCAAAFYQRGILSADSGEKKGAIEDLRQAAKLYFRQGNVDAYKEARDLCEQLYSLDHSREAAVANGEEHKENDLVLSDFFK